MPICKKALLFLVLFLSFLIFTILCYYQVKAYNIEITDNDLQNTSLEDMEIVQQRMNSDFIKNYEHYFNFVNILNVPTFIATMDSEGKWSDINYNDTSNAFWQPLIHLERLLAISVKYKMADEQSILNEKTVDCITKGLQYWYNKKPKSTNWWNNQIGQQLRIGPIISIMQKELPKEVSITGASYLLSPSQVSSQVTTGANLMWFAAEQIQRGLINKNEDDVVKGLNYMKNEVKISTSEGVQPDFSFHQHGSQIYNGGYGMTFLLYVSNWAGFTADTRYAFEKEKVNIITGLLLDGNRWMMRKAKYFDFSTVGRELTRKSYGTDDFAVLQSCESLANACKERELEIKDMIASEIYGDFSKSIEGNKYFWRSDYMSHKQKKYFASVKMVSSRTNGTEQLNNENLKGYWLPFGLTNIQRKSDEYLEIFPVWDWTKLPGVTCPEKLDSLGSTQTQSEKFVGGVSDGLFGIAAMSMNKMSTQAKKSWFFFKDEIVALGSGISSSLDDTEINTTINQCRQYGDVIINGEKACNGIVYKNPKWILHDRVAYLFPNDCLINVKFGIQKGNWKDINSQYSDEEESFDVFSAWFKHGKKPIDASYEYIVIPDTDLQDIKKYEFSNPINIISNTPTIQSVKHNNLNLTGIVFYTQGSVDIGEGLIVSVDSPCIVLLKETNSEYLISVSDPECSKSELKLSLTTQEKIKYDIAFTLPQNEKSGSSVTRIIQK